MKFTYRIPPTLKGVVEKNGQPEEVELKTHLVGTIQLNLPGFSKLDNIVDAISVEPNADGKVDLKSNIQTYRTIMEGIEKYIVKGGVSVHAELDEGVVFESLEDLSCSTQGRAVIMQLAKVLTRGIDLGEIHKA